MKKIDSGTVKYLIYLIILTSIFGFIVYPLFDYLICKIFTKTTFVYSVGKHIIQPLIFAFIYSVSYWYFDKKRNK